MAAGKDARIKSVQVTGHHLGRLTATEKVGGVLCRVTLVQGEDGRYHEVEWRPIPGQLGGTAGRD